MHPKILSGFCSPGNSRQAPGKIIFMQRTSRKVYAKINPNMTRRKNRNRRMDARGRRTVCRNLYTPLTGSSETRISPRIIKAFSFNGKRFPVRETRAKLLYQRINSQVILY